MFGGESGAFYNEFRKLKTINDAQFSTEYELTRLIQACKGVEHHEVYEARVRKTGIQVCVKRFSLAKLQKRTKLIQSLQRSEI